MQLPQWLARFNRHLTNPVQRLWAGFIPTMGILEHVGRRSGAQYRTTLSVFTTGGGRLKRYGRTFTVSNPRLVTKAEAAAGVSGLWRPIFTMLPFENAVLLTRV